MFSSIKCLAIASLSLLLATLLAIALLYVGLATPTRLRMIEKIAAYSQTVPTLVIVTIFFLIENELAKLLMVERVLFWYCIPPVTLSLLFPPLANGVGAIRRVPVEIKQLLRLWDAAPSWRIRRVYLPLVLPDVLTGARASSTWAVGATLIVEGLVSGIANAEESLGYFLVRALGGQSTAVGQRLAAILIASVLGYILYVAVVGIEKKLNTVLTGRVAGIADSYPLQAR